MRSQESVGKVWFKQPASFSRLLYYILLAVIMIVIGREINISTAMCHNLLLFYELRNQVILTDLNREYIERIAAYMVYFMATFKITIKKSRRPHMKFISFPLRNIFICTTLWSVSKETFDTI